MSGTSTDFSPNGIRPFGVAFTRGGSAVWFIAVALILAIATLVSSIASGVGLPEQFAVVVGDIRRALGFETEVAWSAQDWPAWRDLALRHRHPRDGGDAAARRHPVERLRDPPQLHARTTSRCAWPARPTSPPSASR